MDEDQMTTSDPMARLEGKVDELAEAVRAGFGSLDKRLTKVETRLTSVETRLGDVESRLGSVETELSDVKTRLTGVETALTEVDTRLRKVHALAERTDEFAKNAWDSLTSLERQVGEGFAEAKKEQDRDFDLVHKAILHWGERVEMLETAPTKDV